MTDAGNPQDSVPQSKTGVISGDGKRRTAGTQLVPSIARHRRAFELLELRRGSVGSRDWEAVSNGPRGWLADSDLMEFFVGLHQPSDARHFPSQSVCISVNRLAGRRSDFAVERWMLDCAGFTTIATHGGYPEPVSQYAAQIQRWASVGKLAWAVSQDYMCEPGMLRRTGLTIADHQRLTIERYDALLAARCDVIPHRKTR